MGDSQRASIWTKLLIPFFISFILLTMTSYYFTSQYQMVLTEKREVLNCVVKRLELNLNVKLMALKFLASNAKVRSLDPETVRNELVHSLELLGFFNVRVFDRQGNVIAAVCQSSTTKEVHDWDSFYQALLGNPVISGVITSEGSQSPYISLRVPIYDNKGQVEAVLAGGILIEEINKLLEEEHLPANHYLFIRDNLHRVIYYPDMSSEIIPYNFSRDQKVDFGSQPSGEIVDKSQYNDEDKVYIYNTIAHSKWNIVMTLPLNRLYEDVLIKSSFYFAVTLLGLVCIGLLYRSWRQNKSFEEDIQRLRMERLQSVNQLAAGLAHEVRNPLTSIKGFVQLLSYKGGKIPPNEHYVEIMLKEIDRIDQLLNEFQLLTRPLKKPRFVKINMEKLINDVVMLMEGQAASKKIQLTISKKDNKELHTYIDMVDGGLIHKSCQVIGEESQLKQVVINLLKNAIDAAGENGVVDVGLLRRDEAAILTVTDNGEGIPDDILKKIGTPFFTTKEGGNGLGLSVCYNIIENHGGTIQVESNVGKGTTFSVTLPLAK